MPPAQARGPGSVSRPKVPPVSWTVMKTPPRSSNFAAIRCASAKTIRLTRQRVFAGGLFGCRPPRWITASALALGSDTIVAPMPWVRRIAASASAMASWASSVATISTLEAVYRPACPSR